MLTMLTCLITVGLSLRQPGNTPPSATLSLPRQIEAGKTVKAVLVVTFGPGLHAYQNPPTESYMIPMVISSSTKTTPITVAYPKGTEVKFESEAQPIAVYEGTIKVPISFTAPKKAGGFKLKLVVKYQQCTESGCFPPGEVAVTVSTMVKAIKKP